MLKRFVLAVVVLLAAVLGAYRLSKSRSVQLFGGLVTRVETDRPLVALTFDDGPTPRGTAAILPVLDSLGVRATFFVTGREVSEYPIEAGQLVAAGHALANHSWSHETMVFKSPEWTRREITQTDAQIRAVGWDGPIYFRPPYGKRLVVLPWVLRQMGRETLFWDLEPESYPGIHADPEAIARHVIDGARPGSIVLLHVMYESRQSSREAVPLIVEGLRDRGFTFVTLSELMVERDGSARLGPEAEGVAR